MPTDTEERIECLNPVLLSEAEMVDVNKLLSDVRSSFGLATPQKLTE